MPTQKTVNEKTPLLSSQQTNKTNPFDLLPDELLLKIANLQPSIQDVKNLSQVDHRLHQITQDVEMWNCDINQKQRFQTANQAVNKAIKESNELKEDITSTEKTIELKTHVNDVCDNVSDSKCMSDMGRKTITGIAGGVSFSSTLSGTLDIAANILGSSGTGASILASSTSAALGVGAAYSVWRFFKAYDACHQSLQNNISQDRIELARKKHLANQQKPPTLIMHKNEEENDTLPSLPRLG